MLTEETKKKIDEIHLETMLNFDDHNQLLEEFLAAAKEKNPDIAKVGQMAETLTEQCNKVTDGINTIADAYNEDPESMGAIINDLGFPFFWNVMEELSRSMQLELTLIGIALGEVEHRQ